MTGDASGYGELTVILGPKGPQIQGEIPNRIGVTRDMMSSPHRPGTWSVLDGELTILHTKWRHIAMDQDVYVFERLPE